MFDSDEEVEIAFLIDDLNDLVQMHFDILASYQDVLSKTRSKGLKKAIETFRHQHSLQIANLSNLIRHYGGEARNETDAGKIKTKMRIVAGQIFHEAGMCAAMRTNEQKLLLEYERGLRSLSAVDGLEAVLRQNSEITRLRLVEVNALVKQFQRRDNKA